MFRHLRFHSRLAPWDRSKDYLASVFTTLDHDSSLDNSRCFAHIVLVGSIREFMDCPRWPSLEKKGITVAIFWWCRWGYWPFAFAAEADEAFLVGAVGHRFGVRADACCCSHRPNQEEASSLAMHWLSPSPRLADFASP